MSRFRKAVESNDHVALVALLSEDVTFRSPVAHAPYHGKALTAAILKTAFSVFEDFAYVREIRDGVDEALVFEATVDGLTITGCDFIRWTAEETVEEVMVMVRPLRAAEALSRAMGARWSEIEAAAAPAPLEPDA